MLIDGPITTQTIDSSGEILDLKGLDISDFLDGKATANFEHNNDNADDVLGWFIYAKKIFGEQDCENERQKMFWEKVKTPFLYGVLELLDDSQHPGAIAVAAMLRYFKKKNEPVRIGMSIEGSTLERDGHILKRTVGRKVAITLRPCNKQCMLDVLPPERSDELFKKMESNHIQSFEIDSPILEKSDYLDKGAKGDWQKEGYKIKNLPYKDFIKKFPKYSESNSLMPHHIVSNADEIHYALSPDKKIIGHLAVKEHGPYLLPVDSFVKEEHRRKGIANELYSTAELYHGLSLEPSDEQSSSAIALWSQTNRPFGKSEPNLIDEIKKDLLNLRKTLTAGMGNAAPSGLVGGSALSVEDKHNKKNINVLKSVIRDFQGRTKEDFKKAVKEALPDLSDKYVDHFVDLAEDLSLKKFNKRLY